MGDDSRAERILLGRLPNVRQSNARSRVGDVWCSVLWSLATTRPRRTDLRPDGPPEVLAVLVMNDAASAASSRARRSARSATTKRPSLVGTPDGTAHQICPADLVDGRRRADGCLPAELVRAHHVRRAPRSQRSRSSSDRRRRTASTTGTYSGTIANTQPVTLQCESVNGRPRRHPVRRLLLAVRQQRDVAARPVARDQAELARPLVATQQRVPGHDQGQRHGQGRQPGPRGAARPVQVQDRADRR